MIHHHTIPIIVYHKVSLEKEAGTYTLEHKEFDRHIEYISKNNYECFLADNCMKEVNAKTSSIPNKRVMITFDDGHVSDYDIVLPVLKTYALKATFFITTDWIGTDKYMSKEQLRTLRKEGMSIQSHAKTHRFLDQMSRSNVFQEIKQSKEVLEDILGEEVFSLSFPGGRYNHSAIVCARDLGLKVLFSSDPYYYNDLSNIKIIGRCMVKYSSGGSNLISLLNMSDYGRITLISINSGKKILRRIIGNRLYQLLWETMTYAK